MGSFQESGSRGHSKSPSHRAGKGKGLVTFSASFHQRVSMSAGSRRSHRPPGLTLVEGLMMVAKRATGCGPH